MWPTLLCCKNTDVVESNGFGHYLVISHGLYARLHTAFTDFTSTHRHEASSVLGAGTQTNQKIILCQDFVIFLFDFSDLVLLRALA